MWGSALRRNLNELWAQEDTTESHVELVEYTRNAPAINATVATQNDIYVGGTLDIYRDSDDHQYVADTNFEEVAPGSFKNLTITSGTVIRVEYLVDLSGASDSGALPILDGVTDHGDLTGLGDDDHPQYHNDSRGDIRYYTKAQIDALLASNSIGGHWEPLTTGTGDEFVFTDDGDIVMGWLADEA